MKALDFYNTAKSGECSTGTGPTIHRLLNSAVARRVRTQPVVGQFWASAISEPETHGSMALNKVRVRYTTLCTTPHPSHLQTKQPTVSKTRSNVLTVYACTYSMY